MNLNQERAFSILKRLAEDLTSGQVELPTLPTVVIRLREELASNDFEVQRVAQIASTEPALAGTILAMGNSFMHRRAGRETVDLKVAIPRIGYAKLQALSLRFAMHQMKCEISEPLLRDLVKEEWATGREVAAIAYLIARQTRECNPDEAVVVGLLHNIGRIYLCSRAAAYPELIEDLDELRSLIDCWHANIALAIAEAWQLPPEAVAAFAVQAGVPTVTTSPLACILSVAVPLAAIPANSPIESFSGPAADSSAQYLGLDAQGLSAIRSEVEDARLSLGLLH